ncbi:MAG: hypothetical protein JSS66_17015 [Armatimonadetes bacterium]|nr:hypothetical protein [Armatimonadota bacterium]
MAILSAEHGLFGGLKPIAHYDQRMNAAGVLKHKDTCRTTLAAWSKSHSSIHFSLGKDYLPAVKDSIEHDLKGKAEVFEGPIGMKLHQIKGFLESTKSPHRSKPTVVPGAGKITYFLPDWDDLLDGDFDFANDSFSGSSRSLRHDQHCCILMKPKRMCDGVLVSLAQHVTSKGPLRRIIGTEEGSLAPRHLRNQFGLQDDQWLFGDCGAFSYLNEDRPAIEVEQAVALYELHGFDFGASVDHIPVKAVVRDGKSIDLTEEQRQERVNTTKRNAERFLGLVRSRNLGFTPVGTIQALSPSAYGETVRHYCDLGYEHIAVGGLVPLQDSLVEQIVTAVTAAANDMKSRPWIHLFGVFRPKLQSKFRELGVDSFDSATYFRKAWLRSDQNYLAANGKWYSALRIPMTSDGRTRKKLEANGANIIELELEEAHVLKLLSEFESGGVAVDTVVEALLSYDEHLTRSSESRSLRDKYRKTLEDRPWEDCDCPFCSKAGIHVLVFRGANRNKRRGAHNTLML